jgi:hypothetical protein
VFSLTVQIAVAQENAPQSIVDYAKSELVKWGKDPIIVKAVKEDNARGLTLDTIKATDEKWKNTHGVDAFMRAMIDSECGKYLRKLQESKPYFDEIFVMNNLGGNVAMTNKTSDYWQGDEAKFKESFKEGQGAIHISNVEFDSSSQAYLVQVSLPVIITDTETKKETVIGAITIGINVDGFE